MISHNQTGESGVVAVQPDNTKIVSFEMENGKCIDKNWLLLHK